MIKASLIVAILYFLSPIAMTKIQAKAVYGDDNRQEFFKPIELPQLSIARSSSTTLRAVATAPQKLDVVARAHALQKISQAEVAPKMVVAKIAAAQTVSAQALATQTLCEGLEGSNAVGAFCAQYLPVPVMTLNDLESTGLYACEVIGPKEFVFETATTLSAKDVMPAGPVSKSANVEAAELVASLVRVETLRVPAANQCLSNELEMSDISVIVNSITTAMK